MADKFGAGLRLLLVEDDPRTLSELRRILERHSALEVLSAATAPEALELASLSPPHLALLDIRLPGMDGLSLLGRLREGNPELLAAVMTGFREERTASESRDRGAVDFLEKPLDLPYLLAVLRQQSREYQLRRELRAAASRLQRVLDRSGDGFALESDSGAVLASNALGEEFRESAPMGESSRLERGGRTFEYSLGVESGEVLHHWRDVTDSLEAERGRAYRHMGRLLAHELMNPLTPMRLWLQEIRAQEEGAPGFEPTCRRGVDVVMGQVERLASLVRRFRALGHEGPMEAGPVDLRALFAEVRDSLDPMAREARVPLDVGAAEVGRVSGDAAGLYQVLFNLLKNAVEAQAGKPGGVCMGAREASEWIEVWVTDQAGGFPAGSGVPAFAPALSTKPGGTGLGLLICRDLLARMGSSLEVDNRPGDGATFRFRLPVAP